MKILMLCEYFTPWDFGGSEWSTYYLAQGLSRRGINVIVLTPNYGHTKKIEKIQKITVFRFPYFKKIKNKNPISPFWHTNIIWIIWTSFWVLRLSLKENVDIIHVQGKYFIPSSIIAKVIFRKKIVITLRDYILICPLGMCLLKGNNGCNFWQFILKDIPDYIEKYMPNAKLINICLQYIFSLRMKLITNIYSYLLKGFDEIIAVSYLEEKIYLNKHIQNISVIPNAVEITVNSKYSKKELIIYAGRLTPGKGVDILMKAIPKVLHENPHLSFLLYGNGFLLKKLTHFAQEHNLLNNVIFKKYVKHEQLIKQIGLAKIAVVPSRWPEPFGRVSIESLIVKTPVVLTNRVGAKDFIKDGRWGKIVDPSAEGIAYGINYIEKNRKKLQSFLQKDYALIKKTFSEKVYASHLEIYKKIYK